MTLITERLILRPWCEADREPFAALNADPRVMEFFPACLNRAESDAAADRIESHFACGRSSFAASPRSSVSSDSRYLASRRISRLASRSAGASRTSIGAGGYAPEGARRVLAYGFDQLQLPEIVSFTARENLRSRAVMERIGLRYDASDDFDHPLLPENHKLRPHALYRIVIGLK